MSTAVPKAVLDRRLVRKGNTAIPQVRVSWIGLPDVAAMWEDYYILKERFPTAPVWGHDGSFGRGRCNRRRHPGVSTAQEKEDITQKEKAYLLIYVILCMYDK
jgi:hypothetical protein